MALMTLLGALTGGLSNTKAARTSTSTPTYSPEQTGLQSTVAATLQDRLKNGVDVTPLRTIGTDQINKTYAGVGDRLTAALAGRGFGSSGTVGTGAIQTEVARAGAVGDLESKLQKYSLDEKDKTLSMASGFAFDNPGSVNVGAGSAVAGAVGGGTTALTASMNQFLAAINASNAGASL